jgi:carboxypeptidase family protein
MSLTTLLVAALFAQVITPGQTTQPRTPARDARVTTAGTGIIRGSVVDATSGTPIRRATVRLFGPPFRDNYPSALTDDEGRFEISELPGGKFTLNVSKSGYVDAAMARQGTPPVTVALAEKEVVEKIVLKLARGGVIVGRVMDEAGEPAVNIEMRAMQYRYGPGGRTLQQTSGGGFFRTDDLGAFRLYGLQPGQYYVTARPAEGYFSGFGPVPGDTGPATTYFPNAPDPATAQRVTVAAGRETGPIVVTLVSTRLSRIRGRAIMSDGQPFAGSFVNVIVREPGGGMNSRGGGRVLPDGSFEVAGLTPGTYELEVRPPNMRPDEDGEVARTTITVNGEEVNGVFLVGAKTAVVRGRVMPDAGTMPYSMMTVTAQSATSTGQFTFGGTQGRVREDQTFEIRGLYGLRIFRMGGFSSPPSGEPWMLKSVTLNGTDITDRPLDIQPGAVVEGVEMIFTQKAAELSGTVTISGEARLEDAWIILFPADESLWRDATRFVRGTRPDKDGTYRFRMLPGHDDYLLVTALQIEPGQYMDPDFLKSIRDRAMHLSLYDGEKRVQNIRIAAQPQ